MSKIGDVAKKVLSIILFLIGTLFLAAGVSSLKTNVGSGVVLIILAIGAFVYPVLQIRDYISERKMMGRKWIALPAIAVAIPLLVSTCSIFVDTSDKTKSDLVAETTSYIETSKETDESSVNTYTPTPIPTTSTTLESTTESEKETTEIPEETTTARKETTESSSANMEGVVEESTTAQTTEKTTRQTSEARTYVLNTKSKKFHYPTCDSVKKMSEKNKQEKYCTREELIAAGYDPCGSCNP